MKLAEPVTAGNTSVFAGYYETGQSSLLYVLFTFWALTVHKTTIRYLHIHILYLTSNLE